jgi:ABC-type nitrate/sulfonate/bicarbonate transport system substrate-binding protein
VSIIGVGAGNGAVAAMRSGQIDAISNLDPVITLLQRSGDLKIISDTRVLAEAEKVFGGPMPAACLYAPQAFIDKNPNTVQALANAIVRADKWIQAGRPRRDHQRRARKLPAGRPRGLHRRLPGRQGRAVARRHVPRQGRRHRLPRAGQRRRRHRQGQARPGGGVHQRLRQEGQRQVPEGG